MLPGQGPQPTRRTVIGLAYAAALGGAAALGLRLDLPQPPPPVPTRRLVPDEKLLIAVLHELDDLARVVKSVAKPGRSAGTVSALGGLLAEQRKVLTGRLTNDGVPIAVIQARPPASGPSGTSSTSGATTTSPSPMVSPSPATPPTRGRTTVAQLALVLTALEPTDWAPAAGAQRPADRDLIVSVRSVRLAVADLLGAALTFPSKPSPARGSLVARTAPLVYGFEVVAAQSGASERSRDLTALHDAQKLLAALGGTSASLPGGWALPFAVTTPSEATRLARYVLTGAIAATTSLAQDATDAASLAEITTWSARLQALAARWGLRLTAFPGMGR